MARERLQPLTVEELAEVTGGYQQPPPCGFNNFNQWQWQWHHHPHHHHPHHHHPHFFQPIFFGCGPFGGLPIQA